VRITLAVPELAALAATWVASTLLSLYLVQDGRFVWANAQFTRTVGRPLSEVVGSSTETICDPADGDAVRQHARAMLAGQQSAPYAYRYRTATGAVRWALETVASVQYHGQRAVLGTFLDITAHKTLEAQLAHQAFHDDLTALPNRALLLERLSRALARPTDAGQVVAVMYLDLDDFKRVNDAHGHHTGDALLQVVAQRLAALVRPQDTAGRLGGDEFLIILDGVQSAAAAAQVTERVRAAVAAPMVLGGHAVHVTASIGSVLSTGQAVTADQLVDQADAALYRAKAQRKAQAVVAPLDLPLTPVVAA
jgi:diguanylate cyclase (GGDEF)-like protein/PAS domain S-box-containing protein